MRRFGILGMVMAAALLSSVVVVSSAFAAELPVVLPEEAQTVKGKSIGEPKFETVKGNTIKCKSATSEGTQEATKPLGTFHITFKECEGTIIGITAACNSLGDVAKTILVLGTYHLVTDVKTPVLGTAILFLLETVHLVCGIVLLTVEGSILCLQTEPEVSKPSHNFVCKQAKGVPSESKYFIKNSEASATGTAALNTKVNEATNPEGSAEEAEGTYETKVATKDDN